MLRTVSALVLSALLLIACEGDSGSDPAPGGDADASAPTPDVAAPDAAPADVPLDPGPSGEDATEGDASPDSAAGQPDAAADATGEEDAVAACPEPTGARPMRRSEHAGIFDPEGRQVVLFGGSTAVPVNCSFPTPTFEEDTWILDVDCGLWRQVEGPAPPGRARHMAVYDSTERRMLIFGGRSRAGASGPYTLHDDVWALDLDTETWSQVDTSDGPAGRVNGALVYEPTGHRLILFGGNTSTSGMSYAPQVDTWTLDLASGEWEPLQVSTADGFPAPRLFHAAIWDDARQRMVIHGGADETAFFNDAKYFDDLWAIEFAGVVPRWQRLDDPDGLKPPGRFWGGLALDAPGDRYVLFAGHDDRALGNRNDLWTFDPEAGGWSVVRSGDAFNTPANGFCDFPPDFTIPDMDSPERRNAHLFVAGDDRAWTFGGKTDCGAVDDVFELDLATDTWSELVPATVGESCVRKGGQDCNDLCF